MISKEIGIGQNLTEKQKEERRNVVRPYILDGYVMTNKSEVTRCVSLGLAVKVKLQKKYF